MDLNKIEVDDVVNVQFADGEIVSGATVLYVPCATGDSWHLRTKEGELLYVQMFETMVLVEKHKEVF